MTAIKTVPRIETLKGALRFIQNPLPVVDNAILKYGKTYITRIISGRRLIMTIEPHVVQHVLQKNHSNYIKSEIQTESLGRYVGKGLLTINGAHWLRQRRLIQPGFHKARLEGLVKIVKSEVDSFCDDLKIRMQNIEQFGLMELMNELTLRVVSKSLFSTGIDHGQINQLGEDFTSLQEHIIKEIRQPQYNWYRHLTGKRKRTLKLSKRVRALMQEVITSRRSESSSHQDDLLQMLIEARYKDTGTGMTDRQLLDEAIILFVAGHETTANALTWAIYLLLKNSNYYKKARKLLMNGKSNNLEFISIMKSDLVSHICDETLRLYPPAWILDRKALGDDNINGIQIRKNDLIGLYTVGSHRDPDIWPDPSIFRPERFEEKESESREKFAFYPFGGGPRLCIGHQFAMMEMKLALQELLRRFDWKLRSEKKIGALPLITLRPKEPILVAIELNKL